MSRNSKPLADAYARLQSHLGVTASPTLSAGALRANYRNVSLGGVPLAEVLRKAGAIVELEMSIPSSDGSGKDLVTGRLEGAPFMANGEAGSDGAYAVEMHLYASDDGPQVKHVGPDAVFQMVDALLQSSPVPPDALTTYLAHRLLKMPSKQGRALASEVMQVMADYMSQPQ